MSLVVTAPLVIVRGQDGADAYLYRGAPVPSDLPRETRERLLRKGVVAEHGAADSGDADGDAGFDGPPAKNADKATWEAYARHVGVTEEDLAGKKKPEVIELALAAADSSASAGGSSHSETDSAGDGGEDDDDSES